MNQIKANPVADRAEKRRQVWEQERLLKIAEQLERGEISPEQAKELGLQ
jgi:hypothetical protein